jgi:DNA-binding CsgD family transcriptional regulator
MAEVALQRLYEDLVDAVYRAAAAPHDWHEVMALMRRAFPSNAQTFYLLERSRREVRPIWLDGVKPSWLASFEPLYFAPDNPWMRVSERLHRPGVVRTNERLDTFLGERGALFRSQYFNDWMRPQGFRHTLGNTVLAEGGTVANVTLLRPPDMPSFDAMEVRCFERLTRHIRRSLSLAMTLGTQPGSARAGAWHQLPQPAALLADGLGVVATNEAMEAFLRAGGPLAWRAGRLVARDARSHERLEAAAAALLSSAASEPPVPMWLPPYLGSEGVTLQIVPFTLPASPFVPPARYVMMLLHGTTDALPDREALLLQRHRCTASEARLALLLARGHTMRQAAETMGIRYESARVYLKRVFAKLDVHTQSQLVSLVLDGGAPHAGAAAASDKGRRRSGVS